MGNTNTLPVVSQAKSIVQLVTGDVEGAAATQEKFFHECPVVAQVTSFAELVVTGDEDKFVKTNERSGKLLLNTMDGIPVVGHVKAGIHLLANDEDGAKHAFNSATRSSGVIAGGVGGFFVGGPVGAVAGGIAGGAAVDGTKTVVDSVIHDEYRPSGSLAALQNAIDKPSGGSVFDAIAVPVFDGVAGYGAGQITAKVQTGLTKSQLAETIAQRDTAQAILDEGIFDGKMTSGQVKTAGQAVNQMTSKITALEGKLGIGEPPVFVDPKTGVTHQIVSTGTIRKATPAQCTTAGAATSERSEREGREAPRSTATITRSKPSSSTTSFNTATTEIFSTMLMTTQTEKDTLLRDIERRMKQKLSIQVDKLKRLTSFIIQLAPAEFRNWTLKKFDTEAPTMTASELETIVKVVVYLARNPQSKNRAQTRESDSDSSSDDENVQLECAHWNICGMAAQFKSAVGFLWFVFESQPDVILLNEVKAKKEILAYLAGLIGYSYVCFPSNNPRGRYMRGSAILYRMNPHKFTHIGGGSSGHEERNGIEEVELAWADFKLKSGHIYRLVSCYVLKKQHFKTAVEALKSICDGQRTVIAGDLNMNKSEFFTLWKNQGFVDCLRSTWMTNVQGTSSSAIDYVMTSESNLRHVLAHKPMIRTTTTTAATKPRKQTTSTTRKIRSTSKRITTILTIITTRASRARTTTTSQPPKTTRRGGGKGRGGKGGKKQ